MLALERWGVDLSGPCRRVPAPFAVWGITGGTCNGPTGASSRCAPQQASAALERGAYVAHAGGGSAGTSNGRREPIQKGGSSGHERHDQKVLGHDGGGTRRVQDAADPEASGDSVRYNTRRTSRGTGEAATLGIPREAQGRRIRRPTRESCAEDGEALRQEAGSQVSLANGRHTPIQDHQRRRIGNGSKGAHGRLGLTRSYPTGLIAGGDRASMTGAPRAYPERES